MQNCAVCSAPLRAGARFCTQCGAPVHAAPTPLPAPVPSRPAALEPVVMAPVVPAPIEPAPVESEPVESEPAAGEIPARIPSRGRMTPPPVRSRAATWALVTGAAPLLVSVVGNVVAAQLSRIAAEQISAGDVQGAWAPVLVTLALVFVVNAGLLTICTITGGRALRETGNGITRGRGLAVAGLALGAVNLVLWVAGLIVSVSSLNAVLV
ncbi:zinc-ribbon domain-containing protein [Microcella humidisoli]|jgi:hypothetical protein|uniref:Zinc-ribbon domain-containing protein n=1 Tax=Microcella humidisoli TaxID=2963406 RepID=A0ABY5FUN7_9MICO|nr:zinc-ribbon domain-containing protein [Microcella humidisoli]UTT62020.1 hypothetical protein NNL39_10125 [Microcella humidisoli]